MPSVSSPVRDALEGYVAGRVKAERLVIAVAAAYYGEAGKGKRETLQPLIQVIDRASPGIVELGTALGGSGFDVRLAERPFPEQYEAELKRAAGAVLAVQRQAARLDGPHPGLVTRLLRAMRSLFDRP